MSPHQVRSALHLEWGPASELSSAPDGRRYLWYRAGTEAQRVVLWFVGDSLVTGEFCDPLADRQCVP